MCSVCSVCSSLHISTQANICARFLLWNCHWSLTPYTDRIYSFSFCIVVDLLFITLQLVEKLLCLLYLFSVGTVSGSPPPVHLPFTCLWVPRLNPLISFFHPTAHSLQLNLYCKLDDLWLEYWCVEYIFYSIVFLVFQATLAFRHNVSSSKHRTVFVHISTMKYVARMFVSHIHYNSGSTTHIQSKRPHASDASHSFLS